jgi:hypothetical protein
MREFLLMSVVGLGLGLGALQAAEVVVRVGPPAPIVEHRAVRPGAGYVWIGGFHRWDGRAYGLRAVGNLLLARLPPAQGERRGLKWRE